MEFSCRQHFFTGDVQADEAGHLLFVKVATHGVAYRYLACRLGRSSASVINIHDDHTRASLTMKWISRMDTALKSC
ncbi:MAG: hypothetical protein U0938_04865 [Thiobacillus sp.]|nr:hypothetical protein [Thiobacillus sp.]